ncbi:aminoacyl-tRNA hydrolase [candidate division KSB1 bacterium]|nr:aminoacyl-tRNA hydrolase [candidate division KSB1 bacterium]
MSEKYMIVGLGNPGSEYERTRHNIGYMVVDRIAQEFNAQFRKGRGAYHHATTVIEGCKTILAKPLTYMNRSGLAVAQLLNYYDIDLSQLLIIFDEVDLPFGRVRVRKQGGSGGHHGINSVIQHVNSHEFARLRIGIGTEYAKKDMIKFVLSDFTRNEQQELEAIIALSVRVVSSFIRDGIDRTMNAFNQTSSESQ